MFHTSASVRACTAAINVKRVSVLDLISQAKHIRFEKFKNRPPPDMARGNQISNAVETGPKSHKTPLEGLECRAHSLENQFTKFCVLNCHDSRQYQYVPAMLSFFKNIVKQTINYFLLQISLEILLIRPFGPEDDLLCVFCYGHVIFDGNQGRQFILSILQ